MKITGKLILLFCLFYIALALSMIASNNLELTKPVDRYIEAPCYPGGNLRYGPVDKPLAKQTGDDCQIYNGVITGTSISWIEWRYFSDNRGNDEDYYIPVDILVLLLMGGAASMYMFWKVKLPEN